MEKSEIIKDLNETLKQIKKNQFYGIQFFKTKHDIILLRKGMFNLKREIIQDLREEVSNDNLKLFEQIILLIDKT